MLSRSTDTGDKKATVVNLTGKGKVYAVFLVSYQDGSALLSFQIDDKVYAFKPSSATTWKMGAGYVSMVVAPYWFTMVGNPVWAGHSSYYPQDLSSTTITRDPTYITSVGPARFDNKFIVTYQERGSGNENDTVFVLYELED